MRDEFIHGKMNKYMTRQERAMEWGKCVWGGSGVDPPHPHPSTNPKERKEGWKGAYKVTEKSVHGINVSLLFQRELLERNVTMYT